MNKTFGDLANGAGTLYMVDMKTGEFTPRKVLHVKSVLTKKSIMYLPTRTLLIDPKSISLSKMFCGGYFYSTNGHVARQVAVSVERINSLQEQIKSEKNFIKRFVKNVN